MQEQASIATGILFFIDYHALGIGGRAESEGLKMKSGQALEGYWNIEAILQICFRLKVKSLLINTLK